MRTFKFRYRAGDGYAYKTVTLPDDAVFMFGLDRHGNELYEGDIVIFDGNDTDKYIPLKTRLPFVGTTYKEYFVKETT